MQHQYFGLTLGASNPLALRGVVFLGLLLALCSMAAATPIACSGSPFGQSIRTLQDREYAFAILGGANQNLPRGYLYTSPGQSALFHQLDVDGVTSTDVEALAIDLNNDGMDEMVYGLVNPNGFVTISVNRGSGIADTWNWGDTPVRDLQLAKARIRNPDRDDLVVAFRTGANQVTVVVLAGDAQGGIANADGSAHLIFQRFSTNAEEFALATGDFLLTGTQETSPEQIALVTASDDSGNIVVTTEIIQHTPGTGNINGANTFSFAATALPRQSITINTSNPLRDIAATAGRFGWLSVSDKSGAQLVVAIQSEDLSNDLPLHLAVSNFGVGTNQNGTWNRATLQQSVLAIVNPDDNSFNLDPDRVGVFAVTHGDLNRDGREEIVLAFAEEHTGADVLRVASLRFKAGEPQGVGLAADLAYELPVNAEAGLVDSVDIAIGDSDNDGFDEILTGYTASSIDRVELQRWRLDPHFAEQMGDDCAGNTVIGSASCPGDTFLPDPDADGNNVVRSVGENLGRFLLQNAEGTWSLCVADSGAADTGTLVSFEITLNSQYTYGSLQPAMSIPDNTDSLDTCMTLEYPPSGTPGYPDDLTIEDIEVRVAINHPWVSDLTVELTSPRGTSLTLFNRPNSTADLNATQPIRFTTGALPQATTIAFPQPTGLTKPNGISVTMPDFDADSVIASLNGNAFCERVQEGQLRSIVFMPPIFPNIQDGDGMSAQIGESALDGRSSGVQVERYTGDDFSAYLGASVGGDIIGIGAEVAARVTAGISFERSKGISSTTSTETTVSETRDIGGDVVGLIVRETTSYDCYQYAITQGGVPRNDSFVRFCDHIDSVENGPSVASWNTDVATLPGGTPASWAPVVRDWDNLALFAPASANSGTPSRATDGQIATAQHTAIPAANQTFLLIDLGAVHDIYAVRLHIADSGRAAFGPDLFNTRLSIYENDYGNPPSLPPNATDVQTFLPGGTTFGVLGVNTVVTVTRQGSGAGATFVPTRGRYLLLSKSNDGQPLNIIELQAFGSGRTTPDRHPVAVCDVRADDGWFDARVFVPGLGYQWVDVAGDLEWSATVNDDAVGNEWNSQQCRPGTEPSPRQSALNILENKSLNGGSGTSWEIETSATSSLETSYGIARSTRIGAEMDFSAGFVAQINAGEGYEYSSGVSRSYSSETFWGDSLNVGGTIPGISDGGLGALCDYIPQPFAYRMYSPGNTGFMHSALTIDYTVKPISWSHATLPYACFGDVSPPPTGDLVFSNGFE